MELYVGVIGIIAGVFVVIFGGRGLVDLVRGYSERRRARLAVTDDSPSVEQPVEASAATTIADEPRESAEPQRPSHVSNILNKISAANRTEAASHATRQGLV